MSPPRLHQSFASSNSSRASVNFCVTTSHASIRSSNPFFSASYAVTPESSKLSCQLGQRTHHQAQNRARLTPSLDPNVHLRLAGMRDGVAAKLYRWAEVRLISSRSSRFLTAIRWSQCQGHWTTHFFVIKYRSAFPNVWSSCSI